MSDRPSPTFPSILLRAWRAGDPASDSPRRCDALDAATTHRRLTTSAGDYWVCSATGQMVRDVFPTHQIDRYDDWWRQHAEDGDRDAEVARHAAWLRRFDPYRRTGRLYEIGSGSGRLLCAAVANGWRAEGNDISPVAAAHAAKTAGVPVEACPAERISLEPDAYDVILCNNVFEHLDSPGNVLRNLAAALRPGGVIYLQTLCGQSLSVWKQPKNWPYFSPGHTHVPTLVSLDAYCRATGLVTRELQTHGFTSSAEQRRSRTNRWRKRCDKWFAVFAARMNRGHRIECLLAKAAKP